MLARGSCHSLSLQAASQAGWSRLLLLLLRQRGLLSRMLLSLLLLLLLLLQVLLLRVLLLGRRLLLLA